MNDVFANRPADIATPAAYSGLYGFHKYWGKKPSEPVRFLIERLCPEGGLVLDPFLGSGIAIIEATRMGRRGIGIDLNPVAARIARLIVCPPAPERLSQSFAAVAKSARDLISKTYLTDQGRVASRYLWASGTLQRVWSDTRSQKHRQTMPAATDWEAAARFDDYQPHRLANPRFFTNSRINTSPTLTLNDLFTGRALRNLELLLDAIDQLPTPDQEPLRLSLTAAVGQMSKMVFAIKGRNKTKGQPSNRIDVGSWVIGYWRPAEHFEVNVWRCFERRVRKLISATTNLPPRSALASGDLLAVCNGRADYAIEIGDCLQQLPLLPHDSVDLLITDPPHSDRIPYLELSELWNMILGERSCFEREIVVSNAKERAKTQEQYHLGMSRFLESARLKLRRTGFLILFFNAREAAGWEFLKSFQAGAAHARLLYRGCFPLVYSAASIVQDNRKGALRTDFCLVFSRHAAPSQSLQQIPGWTTELPRFLTQSA